MPGSGPHAGRLEGGVTAIAVMIEFESKEAANTSDFSAEYQASKANREAGYDTDSMIIEGVYK